MRGSATRESVRNLPVQRSGSRAPGGLALPAGRWHGSLWVSDGELTQPDRYGHCVAAYERTGLWPVLIPRDPRFADAGEDWVDDRARLPPAAARIAGLSAGSVLRRWWPGDCCEGDCLRPFGAEFPGLARPVHSRADRFANAGNTGILLATRGNYRLGLVSAARPADVPAALGWSGMAGATRDVAAVSAVLRSWEDRFSAVLVTLEFDALELAVGAPPRAGGHALAVAAEHRAFCRDSYAIQSGGLQHVAEQLMHRRTWRFWWD